MMIMSWKTLTLLVILAAIVLMAYIRLAPSDPKDWHLSVATQDPIPQGPCTDHIALVAKGARAACMLSLSPAQVLDKLEAIALTSPRTQHLVGSAAEGRITWVARSFLMGFPDYVTAEVSQTPNGTRLDIFSRLRFGTVDYGVNAARLKDWLSQL
jgi:uncharacterized protein (DUF1499 family)